MSPALDHHRDAAPLHLIKIVGVYADALFDAVSGRVFGGGGAGFGQSFFGVRSMGVRTTGQDRRGLLVTGALIRAARSVGDTVPISLPALADFCPSIYNDNGTVEWLPSNGPIITAHFSAFWPLCRLMQNDAGAFYHVTCAPRLASFFAVSRPAAVLFGGPVPPLSRTLHPPMSVTHGSDQILKIGRIAAIALCRPIAKLSKWREFLPLTIGSGCGKPRNGVNSTLKSAELRGFKPCTGAANSRKVWVGVQRRAGLLLVAGDRHAMAGLG